MAKKKPTSGRKRSKPGPPKDLPDRRSMEGVMRQLVTGIEGRAARETPLDKAQDLLQRAFQESDGRRRIQFAQQALEISPDCADAYVLLAEHARSPREALALYEKGVAAGERALGPRAFAEDVGHFWGILETRPYMRARLGLADTLWVVGRRDEAVGHLQDLLRLNPGDNQGARYTLAGYLLFLDRDEDLARLLEQYPDEGSAAWAYTRALLAFLQQGDSLAARRLLKAAKKTNKHVPAYLLGEKFPPDRAPGHYSPGHESEALEYIGSFLAGWKSTPGAIDWLRANVKTTRRKADEPRAKGPLELVKKWLEDRLPQEADVWQADFRQMPNWVRVRGQPVRPWILLVTSVTHDLALAHEMSDEAPPRELLWDTLVRAMQHPAAGEPHRPTEIQVRDREAWRSLEPHLGEIGVGITVGDELEQLDDVFREMCAGVCGQPEPGLLDVPGVTAAQVGGFYEAAAEFFRRAPWKKVGYEGAVRVECDRYEGGPWYAVLMGQSGLTTGLALYEDLEALRQLWRGEGSDEANARESVATTVTFGEEWTIPVADLEAAQKFGWTVARPDAYPEIFHKERGLSVRPPLPWELELTEGCLRAVPEFVTRRKQEDPAREEFTVPVTSGPLKLTLSWVGEEDRS